MRSNLRNSWVLGVRSNLQNSSISEWNVLENVDGRGVFLLPSELYSRRSFAGRPNRDLVGTYKLVFEFFRLDGSGQVKISARVSGIEGDRLFEEFWQIARDCECPAPRRSSHQRDTQSVAKWVGPSFPSNDHRGMANWIRRFLSQEPDSFSHFRGSL